MNKKLGLGRLGVEGVTTANESCRWRRAWRWGTWKRLVNASETSRSQSGSVARFLYSTKTQICIVIMHPPPTPFFSWLHICMSFHFPPEAKAPACLIPNFTRLLVCSDHPGGASAGHGQSVPDNPGLVTGSGQGRWRLTLSHWVCSVSGTSFTIHLLLLCLFFRLTTPLPLLSFGIFSPSCLLVNCSTSVKYHITLLHVGRVLLIHWLVFFFFQAVKEDLSSCSFESSLW